MTADDGIINLDEVLRPHEFVIDGETVALKQFESHPLKEGGVLVFMPEPYAGIVFTELSQAELPEETPEDRRRRLIWRAGDLGEQLERLTVARAHLKSAIASQLRAEPLFTGTVEERYLASELGPALEAEISEARAQLLALPDAQ